MIELLKLVDDRSAPVIAQLRAWFGQYPHGAYNIVSDYSVGNSEKANDVFSFSIILNHDSLENIQSYINTAAPSDLKACRTVSTGLIQYLRCPVTFSISFLIDRSAQLLRHYVTHEAVTHFLPDAFELLEAWEKNSPTCTTGFNEIRARLRQFQVDVERRNFNLKLARQVHIVGACAALVFKFLMEAVTPKGIRWITDRDAMFDRYDGLAFDLGYIYFLLLCSSDTTQSLPQDRPQFLFELPERTGPHRFDALVRLPDHLAGTLADLDLETLRPTRRKFESMMEQVFTDTPNNIVLHLHSEADRITMRRLAFLKSIIPQPKG